jgi:hypothetical protein
MPKMRFPYIQTSRLHPSPYKRIMSFFYHTTFNMILPLTSHIQTISMASQEQKHNGLVQHVANFKAWMHIDNKWPNFAINSRNIRFGLSIDGFNPFSNKTCIWSTWPIMLLMYSLPLWMAIKRFFMTSTTHP